MLVVGVTTRRTVAAVAVDVWWCECCKSGFFFNDNKKKMVLTSLPKKKKVSDKRKKFEIKNARRKRGLPKYEKSGEASYEKREKKTENFIKKRRYIHYYKGLRVHASNATGKIRIAKEMKIVTEEEFQKGRNSERKLARHQQQK